MYIDRLLLQKEAPKDTKVAWGIPQGENVAVNVHVDGKWRPIAGGGSNTTVTNKYTSDPDAPMLSGDNIQIQLEIIGEELDINVDATPEQIEQVFNEFKSVKFATHKQGNAVLVDYDLENYSYTFQCDDGSIITIQYGNITGLRPDIDGYVIWKTTRDKLPVRENQEEPNPGDIHPKSVNPGPSLKEVDGGGGSEKETAEGTEEVYTVINNNTGEIVDPLELHKLTNVIWYNYNTIYYPFYLQEVLDFYSYANRITDNSKSISAWVNTVSYSTELMYMSMLLYYDYTLKPNTMSKINTTSNSDVSDIDAFFNY